MTDNDIIKALECCINGKCNGCPLYAMNCSPKVAMAFSANIINRQKAEIERLQRLGASATRRMLNARAEAIKEFAEDIVREYPEAEYYISGLVKQMVGDRDEQTFATRSEADAERSA
jgi:hypothetical protein